MKMTKVREEITDRPLNTIYFESPSHSASLLCGLESLRTKGDLFDVVLISAEGVAFNAHRVVLAACSDYFRAMFTDAMKESKQAQISLNGVTSEGIEVLLNYAYTCRIGLNLSNVQNVLSAASHIQMLSVVEACSNYLQSQLDLDNCVDICTLAETYSLIQLQTRCYRFMSSNLLKFSETNDFYRLSSQQMQNLLECDFPVDCREYQVLKILLKWLTNNQQLNYFNNTAILPSKNISFANRLLKRIHFQEILSWELNLILQKTLSNDTHLYRLILREVNRQLMDQCSVSSFIIDSSTRLNKCTSSSSLINSRGMELAIVKVGGFGIGGITNEITYCFLNEGKWRHLTSIPHVEQCNFGTAVLDNELYIVGGCFNQSLQENIHPFGFRYSPTKNKWSTMAPMQKERCRFSLNVIQNRLYAIGGVSEIDIEDEEEEAGEYSDCECYDPLTDQWTSISPLPEFRTQHAAVSYTSPHSSQSFLFISGGLDRDIVLGTMRMYDPIRDTWELKAPMLTPRADHIMLNILNSIYVCGGWFEHLDTGNRVLVDTIDVYNVECNEWQIVTRVPTPRYHAGIVAVNTKIYFIGGFHSDAMFDRDTAQHIECYDISTDNWTTDDKYPQDIWEHTCVTLYIPKYRDDMQVLQSDR